MTKMLGLTGGGGVNCWASENLSGRVHFEGYSSEWRVLSKLSVQPCYYKRAFDGNEGNSRQTWRIINEMTSRKTNNIIAA